MTKASANKEGDFSGRMVDSVANNKGGFPGRVVDSVILSRHHVLPEVWVA
jgi:hypothetical protein